MKSRSTEPLGIKMCVFGLIMQILGALVIKKIVSIFTCPRLLSGGRVGAGS